jgi:hypothetical protein
MYSDKLTQSIAKAANQVMDEQLKGDQHKIDKNKNNKIDAHDFKLLRKEKGLNEKMGQLSADLTDLSHADFQKEYGKPKSHFDPTNFKKPVQPGKEMDRAKALAQRGMASVKKEEVEEIAELSKKTLGSYVKAAAKDAEQAGQDQEYHGHENDYARGRKRQKGISKAVDRLTKEEVELQEEYKEMKVHSNDGKHIGTITHGKYQSVAYAHPNSKFGGSKEPRDDEDSMILKGPQDNQKGIDFIKAHHKSMTEEVEELDEGTMTGITLGQKVKNKQGGYNQDVHHKGVKIGHIEAYKHRTGMRYGSHHDASGDGSAGNRDPEESIADIRWSHAQHLKDTKVKKEQVESLEEMFPGTPEYEKKYGKAPQDMKKGEKKKTSQGEMEKTGKGVVHRRKFSEMLEVYGDNGIKGLFEALQDKEELIEEPTNAEFTAELEKAKNKAAGKDKADVAAAAVKGTKEMDEEVELEERELTDAEMKEREKNVKGMKKGMEGFKERYGKDAKSVMYATATKMAKEK